MKIMNFAFGRLGAVVAVAAALYLTTAVAADTTASKPAADIKATGWYPARVIDQRGMDRYTQAWDLEPCINGGASGDGLHGSREEAEVLDESVADTRGAPAPAGGSPSHSGSH